MKTEIKTISLPEGRFEIPVDIFSKTDLKELQHIYKQWVSLSNSLGKLNARKVNLPEGLSETSFCLFMNCYRVNNPKISGKVNTSFDAYNPKTNSRVQIKACSVLPDLTSFGPKSQWDELFFVDFFNEGKMEGKFNIYKIPTELIKTQQVNKNSTFEDFQNQGKRPRFSIYKDIIIPKKIKPVMCCDLYA